jgi:branched-chain amino acid transport system permease protein
MTRLAPWLLLAAALTLPFIPEIPGFWVTLADMAGIAAITTTGVVALTGIANMTSFGQATFMGFGAYSAALVAQAGYTPWLGLAAAILVSALAALLIGLVTIRLSGHYLALGTIAWSVALYYLAGNLDLLGRNDGLSGLPPISVGGLPLTDSRDFAVLVVLMLAATLLMSRNLLDSRWGRAIRALQGGAQAAASSGISLFRARMLAFVYAGVLAGIAGWLYAHMQRAVNPTPFGLQAGIEYLLMAVVGGGAYLPGAVLGATIVTVLKDRLQTWLPLLIGASGNFENIVFGVALVALLQTAPEGLWPHLAKPYRVKPRRRAEGIDPAAAPLPHTPCPAPGTELIAARHLTRRFGGLTAVNDISFTVGAAEVVGLIGPNGAGKSTTFNLLTGVTPPSGGLVRLCGDTPRRLTPPLVARRRIARSFQHVRLARTMSVIENVVVGAHLRGRAGPLAALLRLDRREEARLFAEAATQLARVGLAAQADQPAASLALGQQRLLEIARALCLDPTLLLLDEPAAGLRHHEKIALAGLLRQLRAEGLGILLVEHDMDFVMTLADRLVVLDFGTRIAEGAPASVRRDKAVIEAYLGAEA